MKKTVLLFFVLLGLFISCDDGSSAGEGITGPVISQFDLDGVDVADVRYDHNDRVIEIFLPMGTSNKGSYVPRIDYTGSTLTPGDGIAQDFTNPVFYTLTDSEGNEIIYHVRVVTSSSANIIYMGFPELKVSSSINLIPNINSVSDYDLCFYHPAGMDVTEVEPKIYGNFSTITPELGSKVDFSEDVVYTLTNDEGLEREITVYSREQTQGSPVGKWYAATDSQKITLTLTDDNQFILNKNLLAGVCGAYTLTGDTITFVDFGQSSDTSGTYKITFDGDTMNLTEGSEPDSDTSRSDLLSRIWNNSDTQAGGSVVSGTITLPEAVDAYWVACLRNDKDTSFDSGRADGDSIQYEITNVLDGDYSLIFQTFNNTPFEESGQYEYIAYYGLDNNVDINASSFTVRGDTTVNLTAVEGDGSLPFKSEYTLNGKILLPERLNYGTWTVMLSANSDFSDPSAVEWTDTGDFTGDYFYFSISGIDSGDYYCYVVVEEPGPEVTTYYERHYGGTGQTPPSVPSCHISRDQSITSLMLEERDVSP